METALWIVQSFLAFTFIYSGICKGSMPKPWLLAHGQTGVIGLSPAAIRLLGITELAGAAGLILPAISGILPVLTPITAALFGVVMLLAARIHYRLNEPRSIAINAVLLFLCAFVAWGRWP